MSSSIAAHSLVIPDRWKIGACYVPFIGNICSSLCHEDLSNRIAAVYEKKASNELTKLFDLRKQYEEADEMRNLIFTSVCLGSPSLLIVATLMKAISIATLFKSLLFTWTLGVISLNRMSEERAKQKENEALIHCMQQAGMA